jgi:hypothetical protein
MSDATKRHIRVLPLLKELRTSGYGDVVSVLRRQSRNQLVKTLRDLRDCCLPPTPSREGDDRTLWPSETDLRELDLAVIDLVMFERERPPTPFWKAYQLVNNRLPGIGLISKLNALVNRASQRLKEADSVVDRVKAIPLLEWIHSRGNPDYIRRPEWAYLPSLYEYFVEQQSFETKTRKRELARIRKAKQRRRKKL